MTEKKIDQDYIISPYRERKIRDSHLIVDDFGKFVELNSSEYKKLRLNNIDEELYSRLDKSGFIINEQKIESYIEKSRKKQFNFIFGSPTLHIVHTTMRCNLKCKYCHANARDLSETEFDSDIETSKKIIEFIMSSPAKSLTLEFQGGEVLLNYDLIKVMVKDALRLKVKYKKHLNITLVSNLILLTDEQLDFFLNNGVGLCTSLDGPKELHDKNRGGYDKVIEGINKIKAREDEIKKLNNNQTISLVNAMPLITKNSIGNHKELIDEYDKRDLLSIWMKAPAKIGFAKKNWDEIGMEPDDLVKFWKDSLKYLLIVNKRRKKEGKITIVDTKTLILLKKIFNNKSAGFLDIQSPCGASIGQMSYDHKGNIYTCDEATLYEEFKIGHVDDNFEDIITSERAKTTLLASINDNIVCDNCAYKPYCGLCPVIEYRSTGNILSKLPNNRCKTFIAFFDYIFEKYFYDEQYREMFDEWIISRSEEKDLLMDKCSLCKMF